jgi:hypothetical protein
MATIYRWLDTDNARLAWDAHVLLETHTGGHKLDVIVEFVARAHRCTFDDIETFIGVCGIQYRIDTSDSSIWYGLPGYLVSFLGYRTWLVSQSGYSIPFVREYWNKKPAHQSIFLEQLRLVEWHEEQAAMEVLA